MILNRIITNINPEVQHQLQTMSNDPEYEDKLNKMNTKDVPWLNNRPNIEENKEYEDK